MKGFRVEGQQLGAQTETVANLGECCHFGHATKLRSFKSRNTHEDPGFGGPIPVTVRPSRGFRVYTMVPPCYPPSMLPPAPPCAAGGGVELFTWVVQPPSSPSCVVGSGFQV